VLEALVLRKPGGKKLSNRLPCIRVQTSWWLY